MTTAPMTVNLGVQIEDLLAKIPAAQRQAAGELLAQYGPRFFAMAPSWAWVFLRRLLAGDIEAVAELDSKLSDSDWLARVAANTARWEGVANYNKIRADLRSEILLRLAPIVVSLLAALVGL